MTKKRKVGTAIPYLDLTSILTSASANIGDQKFKIAITESFFKLVARIFCGSRSRDPISGSDLAFDSRGLVWNYRYTLTGRLDIIFSQPQD